MFATVSITVPGGIGHATQHSLQGLQELLRTNFVTKRFEHTKSFDTNGYLYYIATNKKTKPWENPAKTNKIFVTTSSGYKPDYLDPTVCVNHDGHGEFSTDINDSREAGQWVCIDLGLNKPIEPNYYCLKGPGTIAHCMKNWNLEGSNDTIIWDILSTHIEEKTTWETHNTLAISYPIKMCRKKYRYFRIISTGFGAFEIYGGI